MDEHSEAEGPVWVGHPSQWHYFGWWLLALLLIGASIGWVVTRGWQPFALAPDGAALLVILGIFGARNRLTYTVTPGKIITEDGFWAKSSDELRIKDIRSIAVRKAGLSGLFGLGDIEFSSAAADDAEIVFRSISGVTHVRDLVRRYQEGV